MLAYAVMKPLAHLGTQNNVKDCLGCVALLEAE
jgi:hypothetical protein